MDARPVLENVARVLHEHGLEAILVSDAGVPEFHLCRKPHYIAKLKTVAQALGAVLFRQVYPATGIWRIMRDDKGLDIRLRALPANMAWGCSVGAGSNLARHRPNRQQQLAALKAESERELIEMIRRNLARPIHQRMNFLRKRVGICRTCL